MRWKIESIQDVVESQLCCGCGACASMCPDDFEMADVTDYGLRPRPRRDGPSNGRDQAALAVCPGVGLSHPPAGSNDGRHIRELRSAWGPVMRLWEGYASDPAIRYAGSSGGAATALALFAVERVGMHGVLHIAARADAPHLNQTVLSRTRQDLLERTGSRYAPASPCDSLALIEHAPGPCVFIGKPCDVAAVQKARRLRPKLDANVGLTIGFFCAGTPSTRGTLQMLKRMGVDDPSSLAALRYRGRGWPGEATAQVRTPGGIDERRLSYDASWGQVLQTHRQWRCYVCADHTGEFADIAVGDPWHRPIDPADPGRSLILARTDRGAQFIRSAIAAGYLTAEPAEPDVLPRSQPNLLHTRGSLWGRLLVLSLLGAAAPDFRRMPMFATWCSHLSLKEKVRSIVGTVKRVFRRRLRHRVRMDFGPARGTPAGGDAVPLPRTVHKGQGEPAPSCAAAAGQ